MADRYRNPKFKIKFLREASLRNTPINVGSMIVTVDTERVYFDVFSISGGDGKRINVSDYYSTNKKDKILEL